MQEDIFRGLDDIDWASLKGTRGTSERVPVLLRALLAADPEVVRKAFHELWDQIAHQGQTAGDVTLEVIPFLLRVLAVPRAQLKAAHLEELYLITRDAHEPNAINRRADCWEALRARLDVVASLIENGDADEKVWAVVVLELFPADARPFVPRVVRLLRDEPDYVYRADLIYTLGNIVEASDAATVRHLEAMLADEADPRARRAAASSLLRILGPAAPDNAVHCLLADRDPSRTAGPQGDFWLQSLESLGAVRYSAAVERVLTELSRCPDEEFDANARHYVWFFFPPVRWKGLTDFQQRYIELLRDRIVLVDLSPVKWFAHGWLVERITGHALRGKPRPQP